MFMAIDSISPMVPTGSKVIAHQVLIRTRPDGIYAVAAELLMKIYIRFLLTQAIWPHLYLIVLKRILSRTVTC